MAIDKIKSTLKYILSLAFAIWLLWFLYRDQDVPTMLQRFKSADYSWVILSVLLSLLSHVIRAYRWNLLFQPLGFKPTLYRTFLAVMVGYAANLVMPRMGEVTRCGILRKTDEIPMTTSIGTVIAERVIDLFSLIALIGLGLLLEFGRLSSFFGNFYTNTAEMVSRNLLVIYLLIGVSIALLLISFIILRRYRNSIAKNALFLKIRFFLRSLADGFTSIAKLKNQLGFWSATILIWILYYLMTYVVFFSIPQTAQLSIMAGLSVLIMGGLGMSAPVQGGIGTYHAFVIATLVLYGVGEEDGKFFAFLVHSSQTLAVVIFGSISLFLSLMISKKKNVEIETDGAYAKQNS